MSNQNSNQELCPQTFRSADDVLNNTSRRTLITTCNFFFFLSHGVVWWAVDLLLLIIAIFLPPLTVLLKRGVDIHLLINIILWIFRTSLSFRAACWPHRCTRAVFWIGGVLHAWYIVFVTEGSLLDK